MKKNLSNNTYKLTSPKTRKSTQSKRVGRLLSPSSLLFVMLALFGLGLVSLVANTGKVNAALQGSGKIGGAAIAQIAALMAEKQARTPEQKKINSRLLRAIRVHQGKEAAALKSLRNDIQIDGSGKTEIDIRLNVEQSRGVAKQIDQLGGELVNIVGSHIRAKVPVNKLEELAKGSSVVSIRPAAKMFTHKATAPITSKVSPLVSAAVKPGFETRASRVQALLGNYLSTPASLKSSLARMLVNTSEGDTTHRALAGRNFFGVTGAGVKIGVLSDGVDSLATLQGSGDLPAVTVVPGQAGSGDEGSAMLEIVHDLAPGATLHFATAGGSPANFANNINLLRAAGCDIIVDDIIYFVESPFQDGQAMSVVSPTNGGIIAQAVRDVTADGALYFSSAGNEGNVNDGTSGTWEGTFVPNGTPAVLAGGGAAHNFGDGGQSDLVTATSAVVTLHWANPLGASADDYDIYTLDNGLTTIFDASTDTQDGNDDPVEVSGPSFNNERLVVLLFSGSTAYIRVENFRGTLSLNTPGATFGHSSVAEAFAVAATPAVGPFPMPHSATDDTETFSADGPRQLFFNPDSTSIPGGLIRQKPDITAADGVMCAAPGFNPFFGTSAAAPHAAAIAGLLKSAVPSLTPAQIRTALISSAIDIEGAGVDRDSGAGIVMAYEALVAAGATPQPFIESAGTTLVSESCTPANSALDPNEVVTVSFCLQNTGGVDTTDLVGTLQATGGVTSPSGPQNYGVVVTGGAAVCRDFTFTVGAIPCGTTVTASLQLQDGAANLGTITYSFVTGGLGAPVTVSYVGPAVPIPDSPGSDVGGVPVVANLMVAGFTGNIGDINLRIDGSSCSTTAGSTTVGIDHTFANDLIVRLRSPSGTVVEAIVRTDLSGNNFCQTLLDDESAGASIQSVVSADAPFTGSFTPANLLSAFDGQDPNGTWQLEVQDFFVGDTGNIRAFSLIITPAACSTSCAVCTSLTCPANITQSNDPNQCGAVVNYAAPTPVGSGCGTITCAPPSGSFFPVGTTTVTCTSTAGPTCSFTVTVNDTQPPTITCPTNIVAVAAPACPAPVGTVTTFPAPTASDNCPGVTVVCVPASGTVFPVGTTTVSCTATDATGNTATCSFSIKVFNVCVQDRSNPAAVLAWNTTTGEYVFCCNGTTFTGVGKVKTSGCTYTLDHTPADRRVTGKVDFTTFRGEGNLQSPVGTPRCTISDNDVRNNDCSCIGGGSPARGGSK